MNSELPPLTNTLQQKTAYNTPALHFLSPLSVKNACSLLKDYTSQLPLQTAEVNSVHIRNCIPPSLVGILAIYTPGRYPLA